MGVTVETVVPLCFEKSAWAVVSMVTVLRAGGAFMFLDMRDPQARLQRMLSGVDTVIGPIVGSRSQTEISLRLSNKVVPVDRDGLASSPVLSGRLIADVKPENMAIIQHTSGRTWSPKAIVVTHTSYCSGAQAHGSRLNMESRTRVYQFTSYGFDA